MRGGDVDDCGTAAGDRGRAEQCGGAYAQLAKPGHGRCASTKLVLVGYDQGAAVTGDGYQSLSSAELGHIFAVELFGDPRFNGTDPPGRGDVGDTVNPPKDNAPYPERGAEAISGRLSSAKKPSQPPIAALTQPSTLTQNEPVILSAGESWDPSGSPLTYSWDLTGSGSYGTSTGNVASATHTFTAAGTCTLGGRVKNAAGLSATARIKITVTGTTPDERFGSQCWGYKDGSAHVQLLRRSVKASGQ